MRLSVGMKIGSAFAVLMMLLAVNVAQEVMVVRDVDTNLEELDMRSGRIGLDYNIDLAFQRAALAVRAYLLYGKDEDLQNYRERIKQIEALLEQRIEESSLETRPLMEEALVKVRDYDRQLTEGPIALRQRGTAEDAVAAAVAIANVTGELNAFFAERTQVNEEKRDNLAARIGAATDRSRVMALGIGVGALLIGVLLAFYITRLITVPVKETMKGVKRLAEGDFTQELKVRAKDEFGELGAAVNQMREQLRQLINGVVTAAQTLAARSQQLAAATEEVSATVEEMAGTTQELSSISQQGAENTLTVAGDTGRVQSAAQQGNSAVADTVGKIDAIANTSQQANTAVQQLGSISRQIGDITNVITGIADQTNLLALNAAIEAARAGEQGRGFAVVAEEVRKLAEQSANAAREIGNLISKVQAGVEHAVTAMEKGTSEVRQGVEVAQSAGCSLKEIIAVVNETAQKMQEVADGARQSNDATQQLTASAQQMASSVQEIAASAGDLARTSENLLDAAGRFKI